MTRSGGGVKPPRSATPPTTNTTATAANVSATVRAAAASIPGGACWRNRRRVATSTPATPSGCSAGNASTSHACTCTPEPSITSWSAARDAVCPASARPATPSATFNASAATHATRRPRHRPTALTSSNTTGITDITPEPHPPSRTRVCAATHAPVASRQTCCTVAGSGTGEVNT